MSVTKLKCPECSAPLKSAAGFKVGKSVCCPKCETYFVVEEPEEEPVPAKKAARVVAVDEEEEDEKPKKKKKKRAVAEEDERSYKNSPLRFIILGLLVLVMLVLAYFLYDKKKKEREAAESVPVEKSAPDPVLARPGLIQAPNPIVIPKNLDAGKLPKTNPKQPAKGGNGPGVGAAVVGDLLGGGPVSSAEAKALTAKYTAALVGTWIADLGDGATEQLTYTVAGTYTVVRTGPGAQNLSGSYAVQKLVGMKGLKLQLDGDKRTVIAVFEDDELQHPSLEKGVTAVFRKK